MASPSTTRSSNINSQDDRVGDRVENRRLIKAIWENNWVKAQEIVNTGEITWTTELDDNGSTALHFAVGKYANIEAAKDILRALNPELLETIQDTSDSLNPVHTAAAFGNTEYDIFLGDMYGLRLLLLAIETGLTDVAYELMNDCPSMATRVSEKAETPLEWLIKNPDLFYSGSHYNLCKRFIYHYVPIENNSLGSTDTADVENQETPKKDKFVTKHTSRCLHDVISRICFKLWETSLLHVPHVKRLRDDKVKHYTTIKLLRVICDEVDRTNTSSDIDHLYSSPFCLAVENNTAEAIDVLNTYFERLFIVSKKDGLNIYQLAVLNRSEKVYNYIKNHGPYPKSVLKFVMDDDGNNILHLAGRLAPIHKLNATSGAALQMQRELQWFEEVKRVVGITHTQALNDNEETPMMVFRREHKELRKDGEEWMKKIADSYTITAALIITIVFAAAITVPGGNDDKTGKPIYETKPSLIIFAISDAISLFTATTSLLLFLSILTARYADEDFLYKLPKRLIYGLVMLFVSVTSMMIAFSAALYIMFGQGKAWILIPIAALACLPIASFVTLQFPLLFELISSTYGHGIFGKEKYYRQSIANEIKKKWT